LIEVTFTVNGELKTIQVQPMARLLDVLRVNLSLTGTKEGCGEGECGACSVILDGELTNSCLIPIAQVQGASVTTIEGISSEDGLHPVQQCFLSFGGAQCGICTPGMIVASVCLLKKWPKPTLEDVKEGLSGNLCRCTGYQKIFEAVLEAAKEVSGLEV
jgi:carbon-monoxide dehydrogenase small subunit